MKIVAIADKYSNLMFRLMGIESYFIGELEHDAFIHKYKEITQDPAIGLIMMNEKFLMRYREFFRKEKIKKTPIIIEVPDIEAPLKQQYFEEFIKEYIGLNVN